MELVGRGKGDGKPLLFSGFMILIYITYYLNSRDLFSTFSFPSPSIKFENIEAEAEIISHFKVILNSYIRFKLTDSPVNNC